MSEPIKHNPKLWERKQEGGSYFLMWCPACGRGHGFRVPHWSFDGNIDRPTFTPSLRLSWRSPVTGKQETVCHLNVTAGQIIYHGDCPHGMKGHTLPMQDIPPEYGF